MSRPAACSDTTSVLVMVDVPKGSCNLYKYDPTNAVQIARELVKRRALLRRQA